MRSGHLRRETTFILQRHSRAHCCTNCMISHSVCFEITCPSFISTYSSRLRLSDVGRAQSILRPLHRTVLNDGLSPRTTINNGADVVRTDWWNMRVKFVSYTFSCMSSDFKVPRLVPTNALPQGMICHLGGVVGAFRASLDVDKVGVCRMPLSDSILRS